jgi:hypothetical protein
MRTNTQTNATMITSNETTRMIRGGRAEACRVAIEGLERRTLFAAGISLAADGTLAVLGTAGNDSIAVSLNGAQVVARLNATTKAYAAASPDSLIFFTDAAA